MGDGNYLAGGIIYSVYGTEYSLFMDNRFIYYFRIFYIALDHNLLFAVDSDSPICLTSGNAAPRCLRRPFRPAQPHRDGRACSSSATGQRKLCGALTCAGGLRRALLPGMCGPVPPL
ncbi:hypothetical protein [Actinokineospora sp. UTMC 2448]|uniref:hypothetical protein n=1 Tax=Actinokineospora sp. UTMC 2448 TaxID=2268449 RepID=UPI0021642A51|nr:hypothetical protein [Actinokineospora sp. UTMC 2448]